jgi:hypothetical protein
MIRSEEQQILIRQCTSTPASFTPQLTEQDPNERLGVLSYWRESMPRTNDLLSSTRLSVLEIFIRPSAPLVMSTNENQGPERYSFRPNLQMPARAWVFRLVEVRGAQT